MRELSGEDRRLFLLCGTDMMLTLDQWKSPEEIFRLCYPVYIRRDNDRSLDQVIIDKIAQYQRDYGKVVRRIVTDPIELSSGQVRKMMVEGADISSLIPSKVENYIKDNHLYV